MHIKRSLNLSSISNSPSTLLPIIITAILLVTSLVSAALLQNSPSAHALTPPDSCFAFNAGTGTITNYYNNEGNNPANPACPKAVDIPSTIGGVPVTIIGNPSYPGAFTSKDLTSVTIPSSVTSIGDYAFYDNQLTNLTIPNSVTSISSYAFYSNQLTNLTIPNSVTGIGSYAFSSNQLTSLTIPNSVTGIGSYAFSSNQLTSLNISNPTASMQHSSFENNPTTSMTIGSITYIQQNPTTDSACFSMTGSTVTDYYSNSPLIARDNGVICGRDVTIPNSVTSIGSHAFYGNQLTSLTIPSSVTSIGEWAFGANQLTNLTIPNSVTSISSYAFYSNQLTSLTIPSSVTSIGDSAFSYNQLTNVTFGNSVASIGGSAFLSNRLTSLTLPASVTTIGNGAFQQNQLTTVVIEGAPTAPATNVFITNTIDSFTYNGVTYTSSQPIDEACFAFDPSTGTITDFLQADINNMKANSRACLKRDHVDIPSTIGGAAVTTIGPVAFNANRLASVSIPSSVTTISNGTGSNNGPFQGNLLTNLIIPGSVTSIGNYAFPYNQLTSLTIPSSVTSIGDGAFRNNQLTSLTIPTSVTSIGEWAFSDNQLTSLTIPGSVTSIGNSAFYNNQLTSLTIPNSVTSIGYSTFEANSIREVTIPNSVTSIGEWAFALQTPQGRAYDRFDLDDDPASVAIANQTASEFFYTRLYTEDPTNPNNLQSAVAFYKTELDGDGNWDDPVVIGGHIVNPASAETHHVNQSNASLHEAQTFTGQLPDNSYLHDYNVSRGPTIAMPADVWNPTSEEQAAAVQALSVYYRLGDQLTLTPPTISGYLTPQPHNLTLSQATTNHTFTYKPIITEVPFKDNQSVDEGEVITNTTPPSSIAHPIIANSKLSLPTDSTCQTISNAKLMSPTTLQDSENSNNNSNNQTNNIPSDITLLGGLDFTLDHCQAGGATDIAYTLGQNIDDTTNLRVYKHNPAQTNPELQIQDITNLVNFNASQDGYTTITYNLTDGGELDQDGQINGTIVDPIYIGMLASASGEPDGGGEVVGPGATGSGPESGDKGLASTGDSPWLLLSASSVMMMFGLVTITLAHKHRN